jgi:DNA-binding response OmpR family regulator
MSRILVTEDSPSIRLLLRRRLERAGHEVLEARDGAKAIEAVTGAEAVSPDLVLLDGMMPGVDGTEALRQIKSRSPEIPVIMVSAVSEVSIPPDWEMADAHLSKPIDFGELLARIDLLTGEPPRPGSPNP